MSGPEYTTCCQPADYKDFSKTGIALELLSGLLSPAALWETCDYMLHRKLVCLGKVAPDKKASPKLDISNDPNDSAASCAIGRILGFEPVGSKSFPESIDNDFSINILLVPEDNPFQDSSAYRDLSEADLLTRIRGTYQGILVSEQNTPMPHEADGGIRYAGMSISMYFDEASKLSGTSSPALLNLGGGVKPLSPSYNTAVSFQDGRVAFVDSADATKGKPFSVPVLHCECEGTRIRDVFNVLDQMPGGGSGCSDHWYTRVGCWILNAIFMPMTITFVIEAWNNARGGDYHDALDPADGDLNLGDLVMIRGRWVFDAGHKGHNELHAVHTIQKIPEPPGFQVRQPGSATTDNQLFDNMYRKWCGLSSQAPPDSPPGTRPKDMTAGQAVIYDNQRKPENGFVFHPALDGCLADETLMIDTVEPRVLMQGWTSDIVIRGAGFQPGAAVTITGGAKPPTGKGPTVFTNSTSLTASVSASGTDTGAYDVVVTNPDGAQAACAKCLMVTAAIK